MKDTQKEPDADLKLMAVAVVVTLDLDSMRPGLWGGNLITAAVADAVAQYFIPNAGRSDARLLCDAWEELDFHWTDERL